MRSRVLIRWGHFRVVGQLAPAEIDCPTIAVVSNRLLVAEALSALCRTAGWNSVNPDEGPSVLVLDASLGGEAIRRWTERGAVLVLSGPGREPSILECIKFGAAAIVLETATFADFLDVLNRLHRGERGLFPVDPAPPRTRNDEWRADPLAGLSEREREVFAAIIEGKRTKEIAAALVISPKTVDSYRATLMHKLGIHDVAGLVRYAVRHGLVQEI